VGSTLASTRLVVTLKLLPSTGLPGSSALMHCLDVCCLMLAVSGHNSKACVLSLA
jgi:hypothetical protein